MHQNAALCGNELTLHHMTKFYTCPNGKHLQIYDKINVSEKLKFVLGRIENIGGKGENAGYQHFLLSGSKEFQNSHSSACHFTLV